jgi:polyphenol oxidase
MVIVNSDYIIPVWPAPATVRAVVTTRLAGNLAMHVNDDPAIVRANRRQLRENLALSEEPVWIEQVHGTEVIDIDKPPTTLIGDAALTESSQKVCAILTADCLPIFLADKDGRKVAAIHAGWRGLLGGVIDAAISALKLPPSALWVWLGPAIGPDHFEVGPEVREQFAARHSDYAAGFSSKNNGRWLADIYQLAKINLRHTGVSSQQIYGGGLCTVCDSERFFSYRRDQGVSGRMASLIWISESI